jgi:hypothetical protein
MGMRVLFQRDRESEALSIPDIAPSGKPFS